MDAKLKADFNELLALAHWSDYEREAMGYMVLNGEIAPADLAGPNKTSIPKSKTYEVLEGLAKKGYAYQVSMGKKKYRAARPEEFMPKLLKPAYDMQLLRTNIEAKLVEAYEGALEMGPGPTADGLVQVLLGPAARSSALVGEFKAARDEILIADTDLAWAMPTSSTGTQLVANKAKARVLFLQRPQDSGEPPVLAALRQAGINVRASRSLQSSFVVIDRQSSYLAIAGATDGHACVYMRQPAVSADLGRLFNEAWETAVVL